MKGNIIITGFQGFIGIYTTAKFINEGYVVYGVDKGSADKDKFNLLEYLVHDKNSLHENLKTFFNFDMSYHSLDTLELIKTDCTNIKLIDFVIHYASPVGVKTITDEPYKCMKEALTINMMVDDYCSKHKIPLIFSSSSEVFGENNNVTINSNFNIQNNLRSTYAAQKLASELLFESNQNYASANVRFFNIVGFGQTTEGMVMNTFMNNIFKGIPMRIYEVASRSFCAVEDAVEMVFEAFCIVINKTGISNPKYTYNIGNPKNENELIISKLAMKIVDIYNIEVNNNKSYENDILYLLKDKPYISARKLKETGLKFNNFTDIDTIIKNYMNLQKRMKR